MVVEERMRKWQNMHHTKTEWKYHMEEMTGTLLYIYRNLCKCKMQEQSFVDERDLSHMV